MATLASASGCVRNDLTRNTETVWFPVPTKCENNIRRIRSVSVNQLKGESPFNSLPGENHPGKIRMLQPFNESARDSVIVPRNVKEARPAILDDDNLARLGGFFKSRDRIESGLDQSRPK